MRNLLKFLFFLVYISLFITNQRQFSLVVDNLVPVRIFIICFLVVASCYFIWQERRRVVVTTWKLVKSDKVLSLMIILFLWRSLSLFMAKDLGSGLVMLSWWGSVVAFYFLGSYLVSLPKLKESGLHGMLLGVVVSVLAAIYQTVSFVVWGIQQFDLWGWQYPDGFRVPGLMLDSNHFGSLMVASFFVVFWFLGSKRRLVWSILTSFIILGAYSLSSSRSALLGLLGGSVAVFARLLWKREIRALMVFMMALILGVSSGLVISKVIEVYTSNFVSSYSLLHSEVAAKLKRTAEMQRVNQEYLEFEGVFSSINQLLPARVARVFDASAKSHVEMLAASWGLGLRFPFLGVGYGNFSAGLRSQPDLYKSASRFDPRGLATARFPSHTLWGEQLAETGFVGLALYFLLVTAILYKILKSRTLAGTIFAGVWISFLVFSVFYAANEEFFWLVPFLGIWLNKV